MALNLTGLNAQNDEVQTQFFAETNQSTSKKINDGVISAPILTPQVAAQHHPQPTTKSAAMAVPKLNQSSKQDFLSEYSVNKSTYQQSHHKFNRNVV